MNRVQAVDLLLAQFPEHSGRVDSDSELHEMPHLSYGLLADEAISRKGDSERVNAGTGLEEGAE